MTNETFKDTSAPLGIVGQTVVLALIQLVIFPVGVLWYLASVTVATLLFPEFSHGTFMVWLVSTAVMAKITGIAEAPDAKTQCRCQPSHRLPF